MKTETAVAAKTGTDLKVFRPAETAETIAKAEAVIDFAKRMHDWPLLERAIDEKIEQQREFVEWWRASVTPNRTRKSVVTGPGQQMQCDRAEDLTGITKQQVSKWSTRLKKEAEYRAALFGAAYRMLMAEGGAGVLETLNTGDMEGYTPAQYVEAARTTMGSIDVDPASHQRAQSVVKAGKFFTEKDDGLAKKWTGTVFLNPPYNTGLIEKFIDKLLAELEAGRTTQAILLTNNNTDTRWFHGAAVKANALCLTKGRIKFYKPDSSIVAPTNGQAFFYFGGDVKRFMEAFSAIGLLLVAV